MWCVLKQSKTFSAVFPLYFTIDVKYRGHVTSSRDLALYVWVEEETEYFFTTN